jgi:hypothetical protein
MSGLAASRERHQFLRCGRTAGKVFWNHLTGFFGRSLYYNPPQSSRDVLCSLNSKPCICPVAKYGEQEFSSVESG